MYCQLCLLIKRCVHKGMLHLRIPSPPHQIFPSHATLTSVTVWANEARACCLFDVNVAMATVVTLGY